MRKIIPRDYKWRTSDDDAVIFTNRGDTSLRTFNLPPAVEGLRRQYLVEDADGIKVAAYSGDTIRMGSSVTASGGFVASTVQGAAVSLLCIKSKTASAGGQWAAQSFLEMWLLDITP